MINKNNFLKIEYSLIIVQIFIVLIIIFTQSIPTLFYYLSSGIGIIVLYVLNKKSKTEKIKNIKYHECFIIISTIFLFLVPYILYNWRN
jgi:hypothetical protein